MHFSSSVACFLLAAWAAATPTFLEERAIGDSCSTPDGSGTCQDTSSCTSQGFNLAGYCPGASNIQCCVKKTCSTSSGSGICLNTGDGCSGGSFIGGACPGSTNIQCCVKSSGGGGGGGDGGSGASIVSWARKELGIKYSWGGGSCSGPTDGRSGVGFDCSGLTLFAVCNAINKHLPRTAAEQYAATSIGKRIPRGSAQAGDMLYWGKNGDCSGSAVSHTGIVSGGGKMIAAPSTGDVVKEQNIWISSSGESICDYAMRFW